MTNAANTKPDPTTADIYAEVGNNRPAIRVISQIFARTAYRPKTIAGKRHTTATEVERAARHEIKINKAIIRLITAAKAEGRATTARGHATARTRTARALVALANSTNLLPHELPANLADAIRSSEQ